MGSSPDLTLPGVRSDLQTRPPCPLYATKGAHQFRNPMHASAFTNHTPPRVTHSAAGINHQGPQNTRRTPAT